MTRETDMTVGAVAFVGGGSSLTMQVVVDGMSLTLLALNILLILGGLVLVGYRIVAAARERRRGSG